MDFVRRALQTALSDFVDADDFVFSPSGIARLTHARVKRDALRKLGIPLDVHAGSSVETIEVNVHWAWSNALDLLLDRDPDTIALSAITIDVVGAHIVAELSGSGGHTSPVSIDAAAIARAATVKLERAWRKRIAERAKAWGLMGDESEGGSSFFDSRLAAAQALFRRLVEVHLRDISLQIFAAPHGYGDWSHWLLASLSSPPSSSSLLHTLVWWL
jgi:hypothetical protein